MKTTFCGLILSGVVACSLSLFAQKPNTQPKAQQSAAQPAKPGAATKPVQQVAGPAYDLIDLSNIFNMLGIATYKFPIRGSATRKFAVNYIVEEYEGGARKQTVNWAETLKKRVAEGTNIMQFMDVVGAEESWIRVYAQKNMPQQLIFQFGTSRVLKSASFVVDSLKYGEPAAYSPANPTFSVGQKTPLLVYYMDKRGKTLQALPTDKSLADIAKLFPRVIILYAEPLVMQQSSEQPQTNKQKTPAK